MRRRDFTCRYAGAGAGEVLLVINLKTEALGLDMPVHLQQTADEVIE